MDSGPVLAPGARMECFIAALLALCGTTLAEPPTPAANPAPAPAAAAAATHPITGGLADARAVEACFERMAANAADLSVLFGVPSREDRDIVETQAREALSRISQATKKLEAGIAAHDRAQAADGAGAASPDTSVSEEAAGAAVHARTVLLPLRAARAMLLSAAMESDGVKRTKLLESAAKAAGGAEPVSPWADAERSLVMGIAGLLRAQEKPEALREALDHLAAAKKTITEPDAPRGLEIELGDDVALASVLGIAAAQPGTDTAKVLDRMLEQPAFNAGTPTALSARIVAAEVRLRLLSPTGLSSTTSSAALAGFASEFDRAMRDHRDAPAMLSRLMRVASEKADGDEPANAKGGIVGLLASLRSAATSPTSANIESAEKRIAAMNGDDPWRRIGTVILMETPPGGDSQARLTLAHAGVNLLPTVRDGAERSRVLDRARNALAPLGPTADLSLAHLLFTPSSDAPAGATPLRVSSGRTTWGLKEVLEARAAEALARSDYGQAIDWLMRAMEKPVAQSRPCVECWWRVLDAMLRDPAAAKSKRGEIGTCLAMIRFDSGAWMLHDTPASTSLERIDPELRPMREAEDRLARMYAVDALLIEGKPDDAAKLVRDLIITPRVHPGTKALLAAAGAWPGPESLHEVLQGMDAGERAEWAARLIDRSWAVVGFLTKGLIETKDVKHLSGSSKVLADLSTMIDALPEAARPAARERCAWGLLLSGDAKSAAEQFRSCIAASGKRIDLLRGLGESLIQSSDDTGAFAAFRDISAAASASGETARDHFQAWARMLEILQRQNADGSKSAMIARESRRLMQLNPAAACEECAQIIEAAGRAAEK